MRAYLSRTSAPTPVLIRAANGFQIILGKVRPNTSPGREPSTSSDHCSAEVWRYLYTHVYDNDLELARFRASHILEDPFIWGDFNLYFEYQPSAAEKTLSQQMTNYWTNFAKSGNPNGPGLRNWPQYNTTTEPTLTFDNPIGV